MFTIDLLKGQGIPRRSRPEYIAVFGVVCAVPVIIAIVLLGLYLSNGVAISLMKGKIVDYSEQLSGLADAVEFQKSFEKNKKKLNEELSEALDSAGLYSQWSDVVAMLADNIPDSLVMTRLELKRRFVKIKVPDKKNPKVILSATVPARTLSINVSGSPYSNIDKTVRDFKDRLWSLIPKAALELDEIRVSQEGDKLEEYDVVSYNIDCIFKPNI